MDIALEKAYEDEIYAALRESGWTYTTEGEREGYDRTRALFAPDVLDWLRETQPDAWAKVVKPTMSATEQEKAKERILDRLVAALDRPLEHGGGTLNVLRKGFDKTPAKFAMAEWKPATTSNPVTLARYDAMNLRVMRQVHYSTKNSNSIDLVFFINGLPVATVELKTNNTQSLQHAITQYRTDRLPAGEPLLGFGARALVHFAVASDEAAMTTRLAGKDTVFLPFNRGDDGAAGNPVPKRGAAVSYLWERVWQRDSWLHIVGRLLHLETKTSQDPITGAVAKRSTLLFPRFHQWELVTTLLDTVRAEGPGHSYLVQHSAGSGKTNSIAWTAHGLSKLYDADNRKIFDAVIVVTDRTVLDDQLQKAIKQIENVDGTVGRINADEVRKLGDPDVTSKSSLLAAELLSGRPIVIVTMQTFPFALEEIRKNKGLAAKRFAIIADEAHSSQTGKASQSLRKVLTEDELRDLEDGGEVDAEAVLAADMADRAASPNLSFFAFTATPKGKTLELFGRRDGDGTPRPFHLYTMQQAIDEGYILDVLRAYTTYDQAFRIHQKASQDGTGRLVDESEATKQLMAWVSRQPSTVAQKAEIIVEHFRAHVRHLLDGHAKAMVVAPSRELAARYKEAIDAYIARKGYPGIAALVAFSGSLTEAHMHGHRISGADFDYSEANLNGGLKGRSIPDALASDDFQLLVVANKYQTGFDQPLLSAMYVDKRLDNPVAAVQTLSRLNRTLPSAGKEKTFVVDFANDSETILKAFKPYYRDAQLAGESDVDQIHDLRDKLDAAAVYTEAEVEQFVAAVLTGDKHTALEPPLASAAARFRDRYLTAMDGDDKTEIEALDLFRKDMGSYVRMYDFLSQIVDYGDTGLEKRAMFFRLLRKRLYTPGAGDAIDISSVELLAMKHARTGDRELDLKKGEAIPLTPMTVGTGQVRDPRQALLAEILQRLNDLFIDEDFSPGQQQSWMESIVTVLEENETIRDQVAANGLTQFVDSPDLADAVTAVVMDTREAHDKMSERFFSSARVHDEVIRLVGRLIHENLSRREPDA